MFKECWWCCVSGRMSVSAGSEVHFCLEVGTAHSAGSSLFLPEGTKQIVKYSRSQEKWVVISSGWHAARRGWVMILFFPPKLRSWILKINFPFEPPGRTGPEKPRQGAREPWLESEDGNVWRTEKKFWRFGCRFCISSRAWTGLIMYWWARLNAVKNNPFEVVIQVIDGFFLNSSSQSITLQPDYSWVSEIRINQSKLELRNWEAAEITSFSWNKINVSSLWQQHWTFDFSSFFSPLSALVFGT